MMPAGPNFLPFLIRSIHVASMALLLGGAVLLWALSVKGKTPDGGNHRRVLSAAAAIYEWFFWLAIGLVVMTGVGNLGAFGGAVPGRETLWGGKLQLKLFVLLIFILLSLVRSLLISYLSVAGNRAISGRGWKILQGIYAGTSLFSAALLALGLSLAHG